LGEQVTKITRNRLVPLSTRVARRRRPYALYLPEFQDSFQVFADGRLLGTWGGFAARQRLDNPVPC